MGIDAVAGLHSLDDERQRAQTRRHRCQPGQAQALVRAEGSAPGPNERWDRLRAPTTTRAVVFVGRRLSEQCRGSEGKGACDNGQRPEFAHGFSPCGGWIPLASAAAQDRTPARRPALACGRDSRLAGCGRSRGRRGKLGGRVPLTGRAARPPLSRRRPLDGRHRHGPCCEAHGAFGWL